MFDRIIYTILDTIVEWCKRYKNYRIYKSLPKAATPLEEEPNYYFVPSIQGMRKAGDKPVRYQWILNEPTQGNNKGGLAKKTKGFKQGGLAGTGHNDMRKGGLFR